MADPSAPTAGDMLRHDLRTHLNHVVGYADLLLEDLAPTAGDLALLLHAVSTGARRAAAADDAAELAALVGSLEAQVAQLRTEAERVGDELIVPDVDRIASAASAAARMVLERREALPLPPPAQPVRQPVPPWSTARVPAGGDPPVLLVVDDDEDNRDLLARRLERLGYAVLVAEDGLQALGVLDIEPVDVVLLDLMMPGLDGLGVLEQRSLDERLRDIPVVMISSESDTASVVRCIEMGADDYLPKPFEPTLLQARVGASIERKWLRDQERALLAEVKRQADELATLNSRLEERVSEQVEEIARLARLRRFLSPQLADLVVSAGAQDLLRSHRREIAVLFCDLRGFTSFSETAEPEEVMDVLREFHVAMGHLTHEFSATVGFFAGDGIMVFFNDPLPCPDPAAQALRMAVALRDRMVGMTRDWRRRGHEVGFGIGISFGYATLGEIGFEGRYDYGVIGSVVNLAARLCDQARDGQILISKRAHMAVGDIADSEDIGELVLKGLHAPVPVFRVVGLKEPSLGPVAAGS